LAVPGAREAAAGAARTQASHRLEWRPARDRAQFQILSPGDE